MSIIPSGAKAHMDLAGFIGTAEAVPFQNLDLFRGSSIKVQLHYDLAPFPFKASAYSGVPR
jgi:hypothetical protein